MNIDLKVALNMLESEDIASVLAAKVDPHADESKEPGNNDDLRKLVLVTLERLAREQDVKSQCENDTWTKSFWRWAGEQLAEARKNPSWFVENTPVHVFDQLFNDCSLRLAATSAVGQVYSESSAQLFSILRGNVDLYSLLEQKGLLAGCSAYQASTKSSAKVAAYVDLLAHQTPGMKILELKAGGESMSRTIVKALASSLETSAGSLRCDRYEIADICSDPLEDDTLPIEYGRFSSQLKAVKVNLQETLEDQSYSKSSYDLIVVSGLLWSKGNLQDDLKKVHEMLKPGGRLIVNLPAYLQSPEADFILALLPYNQAAIGVESRSSPFLDAAWWDAQMADAGFEKSLVLCEDHEGQPSGTLNTLIYFAREEITPQTAATPKTAHYVTLVIKDSSTAQKTLAQSLATDLQDTLGWEVKILHLEELILQSERKPQSLVIMLVDYDPSSYLVSLNETSWALMKSLFKSSYEVLWVSAGGGVGNNPEHGTLDGFARTMRSEHYQLHLVTLALDIQNGSDGDRAKRHPAQISKIASEMARRKSGDSYEQEYIDIDGILHTRRLVETRALKDAMDSRITQCQSLTIPTNQVPFKMSTTIIPGLTQGPHYWEVPALSDTDMTSDDVDVQVRALSLHGREQNLTNQNETTEPECSDFLTGVVVRAASLSGYREGDRVVAARSGPFHSHVRLSSQSIARLPTGADFVSSCVATEAAARAYHALVEVARVQPGDSVMIQDGFSPIGQAALRLLDRQGVSDIWTTVSSESEMTKLPAGLVPDDHILPQSWFGGQGASILASRWTRRFDIALIPYADAIMPLHTEHIRPGGRYIAIYAGPAEPNSIQHVRNAPNNISLSLLHSASDLPSRAALQYAASSLRPFDPQIEIRQHILQFPAPDIAAACKRVRSATGKEAVVVHVDDSDTIDVRDSSHNSCLEWLLTLICFIRFFLQSLKDNTYTPM
jgi:NADPH:quinone reductase-like Zn-dependent oxidoreductase